MTTADTATARPSAWRRFRAWRRGRPFWGGLVAIVAGLEIYATSETSIGDMEIKIGPGGMAAYVIPLMLVVAGLLAWFTPAQRHFYGIVVPAVSIYALLEINFGGWLFGTILGMVGGALIFAWTEEKAESADAQEGEPESDGGEYATDPGHSPRHAAFDELLGASEQTAIPRQGTPDGDRDIPAQEKDGGGGRMLAIAIVPLLLVVAGFAAVRGPEAAYAAPCPAPITKTAVRPASNATANKVTTPASAKAGVVASSSSAPAGAQASPASGQPGLLGQIVTGVVSLVDPSSSPSDPPTESPTPSAAPETPKAEPSKSSAPQPSGKPTAKPTTKPAPKPTGKPMTDCPSASPSPAKRLKAETGQVDVGAKPSRMTGSKVTMTNLVFVGIVDLPTADGPITVLKFTMDQAVTDDFGLLTYARGDHSSDVVFKAQQLTVDQNVAFYTKEFQGNLFGVLPVDYTPANPPIIPPPGIPVPSVFFTQPDIQLVWVNADVLTGTPSLTSTLA